jgi:tRNA dimethylallyltransferase
MMSRGGDRGRLLVVLGPTGTGKSELAMALAEALEGEIVGCDAVQVYRGFDRATAKPSLEDRRRVAHHLVDCVDPRIDFSLADYVRDAEIAIEAILRRGRLPVVVGGTGLYLRGLLRGVMPAPPRNPILRARLRRVVERGGHERLRRWLARRDPDSAARIAAGDTQRTVRALEMLLSDANWSQRLAASGTWTEGGERFCTLKIGLDMDRDSLGSRLDARVKRFFEAGLVEEVRDLLSRGVPRTANAFKAIGYREVLRAIEEGTPADAVVDEVRRNTRRYSKRQRSWFRKEREVVWLDGRGATAVLLSNVLRLWRGEGSSKRSPESPAP